MLTIYHAAQVLENDNLNVGYNAATGTYEDLLKAGIIDPVKVRRCVRMQQLSWFSTRHVRSICACCQFNQTKLVFGRGFGPFILVNAQVGDHP